MALTLLNEADAAFADQAEPDAVDFDLIALGFQKVGVISGCAVTAQGTPDMTVAVASGTVQIGDTVAVVSSGNVTITAADATNPRFDLITVNTSGTKAVVTGTAAANPVYPAVPASRAVLAAVYVPANDTDIDANQITDKRVILANFIYRDEYGIYDDRKAWVTLRRAWTTAPTAGIRDRVIDVRFQTAQSGTVQEGRVGIAVTGGDHAAVVNKTITGAANNGSGLIRITATAHGFATGDKINVYGVGGVTAANGVWTITVIDANTFDLQGSTFAGTYTSGGTATNRGLFYAYAASVVPTLDRGGLVGTGEFGDDIAGYILSNDGTGKGTDGFYMSHNAAFSGSEWITAFTVDAFCDYGIRLNGTFVNYGLDFLDGTFTGGMIRLKNNSGVYARNVGNTADILMWKPNTLNEMQVDAVSRFNSAMTLSGIVTDNATVTNATAFTISPTLALSASFVAGMAINPTLRIDADSLTQEYALQFIPSIDRDSGGTSHDIAGPIHGQFVRVDLKANYTGTVTEARGITLENPSKNGGSGVLTTYMGLYIAALTAAGTNYAIYNAGTAPSYFGDSNLILGTTTGVKIGTATTQKLGFFNATPIVQPANTTDLRAALINLGLLATGGASPLDLNGGTLTAADAVGVRMAFSLGKAGTIPAATTNDTADFTFALPYNMTGKRLKVTCLTKPSGDTTLQLRRSTDSGNSYSDVTGWTVVITAAGTAKMFTSDPTDATDWAEGDVFNFSITGGGGTGTNVVLEIIGATR